MPEYKSQHYVPKFYLRFFSSDGGKNIALLNFKQCKIVSAAALEDQCAKDYFYSENPGPEKTLNQTIETPACKTIRQIIQTHALPKQQTEDSAILLAFVVFQHSRTLLAAEEGAALFRLSLEPIYKQLARESGQFTEAELNAVEIKLERPANQNIATAAHMFPLLLDLKAKLLINRTGQDFITSDHPVAKINQYFFGNHTGGITGWGSKGLQVFMPLSPQHTIMLYDEGIYKVGTRKSDTVFITQESDIAALNRLQILNANQNVYFQNPSDGWRILKQFESCQGLRAREKICSRTFDTVDENGTPAEVQHVYPSGLPFDSRLSFCSIQTAKQRIPSSARQYGPRQPALSKIYEKFMEAVNAGAYKASEWDKFLEDNSSRS